MTRPVLLYYREYATTDKVTTVLAVGNPLVWWAGTGAVAAGIVEISRRLLTGRPIADHPLVPILLGYLCLMLPWVPGTRIPYIYNYLPVYPFAILALVYWLSRAWEHRPWGAWFAVAFAACTVAVALYFLPVATALPISHEGLRQHIWLGSWDHVQFR